MNIDDPKLTAYALGELSAIERAEIERQLRDDPQARAFVEETAAFGAMLGNAFHAEQPPVELAPKQRSEVIRQSTRKIVPFQLPRVAWQGGIGALAASVAIALLFTWSMGPFDEPNLADTSKKEATVLNGLAASSAPAKPLPAASPLAATVPSLPEDGSQSLAILDSKDLAPAASLSLLTKTAKQLPASNISMADASQPKSSMEMPASNANTYTGTTTVTSGSLTITSAAPAAAPAGAEMVSMDRPIAMAKAVVKPTPAEANTDPLNEAAPAAPPALGGSDILPPSSQVVAMEAQPRVRGGATLATPGLPGTDARLRQLSRSDKAKNIKGDTFIPTSPDATSNLVFTSVSGDTIADLRSRIQTGQRPAADAIPVDALINAFQSQIGNEPLETEVARCPWNDDHRLLCIRVKNATSSSRLKVDFGPDRVKAYRLICGQPSSQNPKESMIRLGSGPSVTILYEIVPAPIVATLSQRLATVRVIDPAAQDAKPVEQIVPDRDGSASTGSADFRLAAAAAEFGLLLSVHSEMGTANWNQLEQFVANIEGPNTDRQKAVLLELIRMAKSLDRPKK